MTMIIVVQTKVGITHHSMVFLTMLGVTSFEKLFAWKHNLTTLPKDQSPKPYVNGKVQRSIPFSNVQSQVFKKCFLNNTPLFKKLTIKVIISLFLFLQSY
jgi:hypothetical protein